MKSKLSKSKFLPFLVVALVFTVAFIATNLLFRGGSFFSSVLNSKAPEISIDPSSIDMTLAESHTFTSYSKSSTGSSPITSNWSLKSDATSKTSNSVSDYTSVSTDQAPVDLSAKGNAGIFLEGCSNSPTCIFHSGTTAKDVTLVANSDGAIAEAPIHITADLPASPFSDTIPDWAQSMVYSLYNKKILVGYPDGTFGANQLLTRGQAVVLFYNLTKSYGVDTEAFLSTKSCDNLVGMKSDHYAFKAVCYGFYTGWLKDLDMLNGFQPDSAIKRNEVALLTMNVIGDKSPEKRFNIFVPGSDLNFTDDYLNKRAKNLFNDVTDTTKYRKAISTMELDGIMMGSFVNDVRLFRPEAPLTRAEMAKILGGFINLITQVYQ